LDDPFLALISLAMCCFDQTDAWSSDRLLDKEIDGSTLGIEPFSSDTISRERIPLG
jgi:hypothetical protein